MLVVLLHHAGILKSYEHSIMHVFNFFMPWFFFKAGIFHRFGEKLNKQLVRKYLRRYFVPLAFCSLTSYILTLIGSGIHLENGVLDILKNIYNANGVIWFLIAFLITKILFVLVPDKKKDLYLIASLLFIISAYCINSQTQEIPLVIKEVIAASLYYTMGIIIGKEVFKDWKRIIILTIIYAAYIVLQPSKIDMRMEYIMWGEYGIAIIGNIVGIVLINSWVFKTQNIIPSFVKFIGVESMTFYILHIQIYVVVKTILSHLSLSEYSSYACVLVTLSITPLIIFIFKKLKIQWLLGN